MAKKSLAKSPDGASYEKLAALLRSTRESKKASQEGLAKVLGESKGFIQKIEYMQRRVDVVEFYRIARELSVDPVELFKSFVQQLESE